MNKHKSTNVYNELNFNDLGIPDPLPNPDPHV